MSYIVTGGAGFVGSNMVKKLNEKGITDIIIIDSYGDDKMKNLLGLKFRDFVDYQDGLKDVGEYLNKIENPEGFFHIGANADVLVYPFHTCYAGTTCSQAVYLVPLLTGKDHLQSGYEQGRRSSENLSQRI